MPTRTYKRPSAALQVSSTAVIVACVSASILQAREFLDSLASTAGQSVMFALIAGALLFGSLVLSRLTGELVAAAAPAWIPALTIATVLALEVFSVGTSASGFSTRLLDSQQQQNAESTEYRSARATVEQYREQIAALNAEANRLPENYRTRRQGLIREANALLPRLERAERRAAEVDVSSTGRALASLEGAIGLSAVHLALLSAVLLSLVPAVLLVATGALYGQRPDREAQPMPGKPQARPGLRVAA